MKITINYENREALEVINTIKTTVDMYEGFGMDTDKIQDELNNICDQILDGKFNACSDSHYAGFKVDAANKTVEFEINPDIFVNNMKTSTVILRKFKPVVTMIKSVVEVCEGIITSTKEMIKKEADMAAYEAKHNDMSYLVTKKEVAGVKVIMMARKTRWGTYEMVQAETVDNKDISGNILSTVLTDVMNNVDPTDWNQFGESGYMNMATAEEFFNFYVGGGINTKNEEH